MHFQSIPCLFLGYNPMHKGYKCLDLSSDRMYISQDVVFNENSFPFSSQSSLVQNQSPPNNSNSPTYLPSILGPPPSFPSPSPSSQITPPLVPSSPSTNSSASSFSTHNPLPVTSSVPSLPPDHPPPLPKPPIITRSKTNSSKPKTFTNGLIPYPSTRQCLSTSLEILEEPSPYIVAARFQEWRNAMSAEFQALIKVILGLLFPLPLLVTLLVAGGCLEPRIEQMAQSNDGKHASLSKGFTNRKVLIIPKFLVLL